MDPVNELGVAFYEMRLKIDTGTIDRELIEQPQLYFKVAESAARANSRVTAEKEELARVEARLYRSNSLEKEELGQRVTEAVLKNEIILHKDRTKQSNVLQEAIEEAASWTALRESFNSRAYMLRDLCQFSLAGFLASSSVSGAQAHTKDVKAEQNKEALAKKRKTDWKKDL